LKDLIINKIEPDICFGLPDHMKEGALLYLKHGIRPGGFLYSVLCNDLHASLNRADQQNLMLIHMYRDFLMNLPPDAWGNQVKVEAWISSGGELGRENG